MMNSGKTLAQAVRNRGWKLTRQRKLVLEILENSRGHLDAEMVFTKAKEQDKRIGIATVYRTLAFLKQLGLAEEHRLGEDHGHFEATNRSKPHYHFACLKCGKIVEFQLPQVMRMARLMCEKKGLQVVEISLDFRGYCAKCRPTGTGCAEKP